MIEFGIAALVCVAPLAGICWNRVGDLLAD